MQIKREGRVVFHDASLAVWEEGISDARAAGGYKGAEVWEREFKRQVFARIVQQLNRLGWTLEIPAKMIKDYGESFARNRREGRKGDLQCELSINGRHIELKMWQDVANVENPNGGRYDFNKEQRMPYLLRLEMERTRRRIRTYLCNVFEGYVFDTSKNDGRFEKRGPNGLTAMEFVEACWRTSWHFKGDTSTYQISDYNRKSADGKLVEHGQRVYFSDWKGRMRTGTAYYNINNMWWVVSGKYGVDNKASSELYAENPGDLRRKRNERARRSRLEQELNKAIAAMDFRRAEVLRDLIFPQKEPLFVLWHREHKAYHCANFSGYASDQLNAGKFTRDELKGWENETNKVVALGEQP